MEIRRMNKEKYLDKQKLEEESFYYEMQKAIELAEKEKQYQESKIAGKEKNLVKVKFDDYESGYYYYKAKYEAIRDASFWRMTEPLRKLVDYYQWKKNGIKKIKIEDEISVPHGKEERKHTLIGVHLHLYYEDLLDEFCDYLNHIPEAFDLYISCKKGADHLQIKNRAKQITHVKGIIVKETQNRGRDIAPFYVLFGKDMARYEYVLHIHTKKSLYTGGEKANWRHEALDGVLKSEEMVAETLRMLRSEEPEVGLVFGEMTKMLPPMALHWLRNVPKGREVLERLHIPFENHMFFYPVGSFFWAKTEALRPLFQLRLKYSDFDEEKGQIDGTLAHALERVIAFVIRHREYDMCIYDADSNTFSKNVSYKCFRQYFTHTSEKLSISLAEKYDVITFDIFDTLITRLVYQPDDLFRLMGRKIQSKYHIRVDYLTLRKEAERLAWEEKGDFCNIHHIYEKMPLVSGFTKEQSEELKQMEIDLEYELCIPRRDVLELFNRLVQQGKKIILISDMYLTAPIISRMLEKCGYQGYDDLWISCEKGKRKDRDTIWDDFLEQYGQYRTIHIGDNPHSDCQLLVDRGRDYVLFLSSADQFRFSKQYEKFSKFENTTVENSIMLGYFVNGCFYNSPFALTENGVSKIKSVEDVAKGIFAPVLLKYMDYLHKTSHNDTHFLFLAREGYFLEKLYVEYCQAFGLRELEHTYFLTSRRATSVAQIRNFDDIRDLLKTEYKGKLSTLLKERFGLKQISLGVDEAISLPEDVAKVMRVLLNCIPEILAEAKEEKDLYLKYIHQTLGAELDWDKVTLVDVGYSGTIQYYLMKILNTKLDGCYMMCGYNMKPDILDGTYRSPYTYWKEKSFIDTQLFLEAVTAAPHGQVVRFKEVNGKIEAELKPEKKIYGDNAEQFQWHIYQYVKELGKILGDIDPKFDGALAGVMFGEILRKGLLDSALRKKFFVNDEYCMDGDWMFDESKNSWELRQ